MHRLLTLTLLAGALVAPAPASADVRLGGAISMRTVDAHHATLEFASDRLPRTSTGKLDARVLIPNKRVSALKAAGKHGDDTRYTATITSKTRLRTGARYTVRLEIAGQRAIVRKIKLVQDSD